MIDIDQQWTYFFYYFFLVFHEDLAKFLKKHFLVVRPLTKITFFMYAFPYETGCMWYVKLFQLSPGMKTDNLKNWNSRDFVVVERLRDYIRDLQLLCPAAPGQQTRNFHYCYFDAYKRQSKAKRVSLLLIQQQYWSLFIALDVKEDKAYNYYYSYLQQHVHHIISNRCTTCTYKHWSSSRAALDNRTFPNIKYLIIHFTLFIR